MRHLSHFTVLSYCKMLSSIIIFIIILLFYLHLMVQFKTSEDLEIYETDFISNHELQEICNLRQPVLFEFKSHFPDIFESPEIDGGSIGVNVRDKNEMETIRLPFDSAMTLMRTDEKSRFTSENNPTIIINEISRIGAFLKPQWVLQETTDVIFGSDKATTPLQYHTNYRTFLCVKNGKVRVKMTPYKSRKYLGNSKIATNETDERIRYLDFEVNAGYILYVPPRWYYSIQLFDTAQVCGITYNTAFSLIANLPEIIRENVYPLFLRSEISRSILSNSGWNNDGVVAFGNSSL